MKKNILVVEDEKILLDLYAAVLLRQGDNAAYQVEKAENAEQACRIVERHCFDLILTDYHLPGADGISLIRTVKQLYPATPVILISGYLSPEIQKTALEAGAVTCLKKPCSISAILATVEKALAPSGEKIPPPVTDGGAETGEEEKIDSKTRAAVTQAADGSGAPGSRNKGTSPDAESDSQTHAARKHLEGLDYAALYVDNDYNTQFVNAQFSLAFAPLADHEAGRCHELLYGLPLPCPNCPLRQGESRESHELERKLRLGEHVVERIEPWATDGDLPRGYILNLIPRLAEEATAAALDHTRKGPLDFFMLALDKSGRIVFCDDHFPQLFQLKKADILGYNISEFLYSYFLHYLAKQEKDFLTFASGCGDRPVTLDFLSGRDRERRPILCEFMLRDASFPASWEMLLIGMDMKQRLELNRLIEFERESLHQLRYGQFDMVITIDKDFRIKTINNACLDKLKAKQRDLADTDFADLLARACDRRSFAQGVAQAQTLKDVFNLRLDLAFREQVIPSLANISAVRDSFNDEIGYVIVLRDIERQLKMEATLRHVERMQALGQLAAGTAHQINNYTNAVLGSTDLLADFVESAKSVLPVPASEAEEVLNIIRESVQKLTSLTHHLTAFARAQQAPVISAGDVNSVVTGTLELTNTLVAKKAISLDIDLAENLPAVYFSPLHLEQAVLNILMNAVDAVGDEGGRLAVSTFREQNHVCIRIADNGPGIPTEVRGRLFEAFVTTKPEGVGTGLGLNVARDVVDSIKGEIKVDSEPGKGTTMTIRIPVPAKGETANA